jgi:hypothetical protein
MPHNEINFEGKTVVELYEDIVKQNIVNLSSITLSSFRESLLRDNVDATDSDWSFLKELIPESAAFQLILKGICRLMCWMLMPSGQNFWVPMCI